MGTPFVDGVQLHLERGLVLLHHVLEGDGGVFCVLPLCALPTHGGLTGLAVKVHHLWKHKVSPSALSSPPLSGLHSSARSHEAPEAGLYTVLLLAVLRQDTPFTSHLLPVPHKVIRQLCVLLSDRLCPRNTHPVIARKSVFRRMQIFFK